jgi:ABC-type Na+ transport system ATPase subunit NatA
MKSKSELNNLSVLSEESEIQITTGNLLSRNITHIEGYNTEKNKKQVELQEKTISCTQVNMLDEHCTPYDIRESREFSRSPPKLKTPMRFIAVSSPKSEFAENITESIASVYHIKNREIIEYQPDQSIHGCGYSPFC